jgi:hypothetical protein
MFAVGKPRITGRQWSAVAVRTIMGVPVVDCDDEHKENESEKEPGEAESRELPTSLRGKRVSLRKKTNGKK